MSRPFKLKSGNNTPFALMGSSPIKSDDLYGLTLSADASTKSYASDKGKTKFDHDPFASFNAPSNLGSDYADKTGSTTKTGVTYGLKGKVGLLGSDKFNLSGKGGVTHYTGNQSQSEAFQGASNFARGYGKELFTDAEKSMYSSTKTMNPSKTNVFGGLNLSLGTDKYRGFHSKFDIGGGVNLQRTASHLTEKGSAGVSEVHTTWDMPSGGTVRHRDIRRGGTAVHGSPGWHLGEAHTPSQVGDVSQTGAKATSQDVKDVGIKTYKIKGATTKVKPYLNLAASHSFPFSSSHKSAIGTLSAGYGTKYSPDAGFKGQFGIQKGNVGGSVGYQQGKGWMAGLSLNIGNRKKR